MKTENEIKEKIEELNKEIISINTKLSKLNHVDYRGMEGKNLLHKKTRLSSMKLGLSWVLDKKVSLI